MYKFRFETWRRIKEIMADAPWSNYDLLVGISLFIIGSMFLIGTDKLRQLRALFYLIEYGSFYQWGAIFLFTGFFNLATTLWCVQPPFIIRLFARMTGAFCFLTLAFSNMQFSLWIPPTVVYLALAVWSTWGIIRTKSSGR